mgnify:CR=1 FL=1
MERLYEKIRKEGTVIGTEILKVDNFLNHRLDVEFLDLVGREFHTRFAGEQVDSILTVEVSGIAVAVLAARYFQVPVVYAKKHSSKTLSEETYNAEVFSFTKKTTYQIKVDRKFISPGDRVLILDDFLAKGQAALGLIEICRQAGATVVGAGMVIEKDFQEGGRMLRDQGVRVESLARIRYMDEERIEFMGGGADAL